LLASTRPSLAAIARHLPAAAEWSAAMDDIAARVEDLSRTIADAVSDLDLPEEGLEALDSRLTLLNRLERKYLRGANNGGATRSERLLASLEQKRTRLEELENRDATLAALERDIAAAEADARKEGEKVSAARAAAGRRFAKAVVAELKDLGFLKADFSVAVEPGDMGESGLDRVVYMFGPNPGEPARPLADIASSGEIARVMLAIKTVQSSRAAGDARPVLVFDEIDANIGGEAGRVVGEKMRAVARDHQVIAITHLPQSAACGDRHLVVSKSVSGGRTRTRIEAVEGAARAREIARMLGGGDSAVVARHAEELLSQRRNAQ
jgi:DNA repair protein RecN (Recombination protein N)